MPRCYLLATILLGFTSLSAQSLFHRKTAEKLNHKAPLLYRLLGGHGNCPSVIIEGTRELAIYVGGEDNRIAISPLVVDSLHAKLSTAAFDDALLIIMGHELWHCIQKQSGIGFGRADGQSRLPEVETSADLHGLLAAQLLGNGLAITIFDSMMTALPLNEKSHLIISKRKEQDALLLQKAVRAVQFFDLGAAFLLKGEDETDFTWARLCYEAVGQELAPLPEIQFNLGMSYLLEALHGCAFRYVLPIEINSAGFARNILKRGPKGAINNGMDVSHLLLQADAWFTRALAQRSDFDEAHLGRYCVQSLLQQGDNAPILENWLNKYQKSNQNVQYRKMQVLYAVTLLMQESNAAVEQAITLLRQVRKSGDDLAARFASINLVKLNQEKKGEAPALTPPQRWPSKNDAVQLSNLEKSGNWMQIQTPQGKLSYLLNGNNIQALAFDDRIVGIDEIKPGEIPLPALRDDGFESGVGQFRTLDGEYASNQTTAYYFLFRLNGNRTLKCLRLFYFN